MTYMQTNKLNRGPFINYDRGWTGKKGGAVDHELFLTEKGGSPKNIGSEGGSSYCCRALARQHTILDTCSGFSRVHSTQSFALIYVNSNQNLVSV
jgi:hypothetical protein